MTKALETSQTYIKIDGCGTVEMSSYDFRTVDVLYVRWKDFASQMEDILDSQETGEELQFKITILPPKTDSEWERYCEENGIDWGRRS